MQNKEIRSAVIATAMLLLAAPAHAQPACDADLDGDGTVGTPDLAALLNSWGPCGG